MHVNWKHAAIVLGILPVAMLLVAWIGFFNVGASSGHWKVTEWFLHFAMRSAVRTYALSVDVPDELPRQAIQPAAAHYARGCAMCHGAPGEPRTVAVHRMLPQPPDLAQTAGQWTDAELFRIVKHGIRFTGMPAWPAQERDDEVWAMVAFLRELPALSSKQYRDLAYGPHVPALRPTSLDQTLEDCARCHGDDGQGRSPFVPVIAGQSEAYLLESLRAYALAKRPSGVMGLVTSGTDESDFAALARHFAALPANRPAASNGDPELMRIGVDIAQNGIAARNVPACLGCHGGKDRNPVYPTIAGQPADYLKAQLDLFQSQKRGGTSFAPLMHKAASELTASEREALAAYFSSQPWLAIR